jgi:hypothetical protein
MSDAEGDKPQQKRRGKGIAPKKWAQSGDIYLNVGNWIEKEEMIDHQLLRIDYKQEFGQIRGLDPEHVKKLVTDFEVNPPPMLDLTCWRHPGMKPHMSGMISPLFISQWSNTTTFWTGSTSSLPPARSAAATRRTGRSHPAGPPSSA